MECPGNGGARGRRGRSRKEIEALNPLSIDSFQGQGTQGFSISRERGLPENGWSLFLYVVRNELSVIEYSGRGLPQLIWDYSCQATDMYISPLYLHSRLSLRKSKNAGM